MFKGVGVFFKNSVELGFDDVKGIFLVWISCEYLDVYLFIDLGFEGFKDVLVGVIVEYC